MQKEGLEETGARPPETKKISLETNRDKLFNSALKLERETLDAYRDLNRIRAGRKVSELSPEEVAHYKALKDQWIAKRDKFLAALEDHGLLKRVDDKESMTKIVTPEKSHLEPELDEIETLNRDTDLLNNRLNTLDDQIKVAQKAIEDAKDRALIPGIGPHGLALAEAELKELLTKKGQWRQELDDKLNLLFEKKEAEKQKQETGREHQTGPTKLSQEPDREAPSYKEIDDVSEMGALRRQATELGMQVDQLKEQLQELNAKIIQMNQDLQGLHPINAIKRSEIQQEMEQDMVRGRELKKELLKSEEGWGKSFKDKAKKAFEKFRKILRVKNPSEKIISLGISRGPDRKAPEGPEGLGLESSSWPSSREYIYSSKERKNSKWGWLKERAKGFALGFGWWEAHQAEKFRSATKESANRVKLLALTIKQERNLSLAEAQEEVIEISDTIRREKLETTPEEIEKISRSISSRKEAENNREIQYIVDSSWQELARRLNKHIIEKYRGHSGSDVLTRENELAFKAELEGELSKLRNGAVKKDLRNYARLMRQNLDRRWWTRYLYIPLDAVLGGLLMKFVLTKAYTKFFQEGSAKATDFTAKGKDALLSKEAAEVGLKDTIWGEAKRNLVSNGILNPTDAQIQEVATVIAKDSGVKVVAKGTGELLWDKTAGGIFKDLFLKKGFLLKMGGANKLIAGMKAAAHMGSSLYY